MNIGYYCLFESVLVGHEGRILAIEPNPVSYEFLSKNIRVNGIRNVQLRNECVWSENREVTFLMAKASNLSRVVEKKNNAKNGHVIRVQARCLDDIIGDFKRFDFLRMDIEGGEYELLKGAKRSISRFHPKIFLELHIPILGKKRCRVILEFLRNYGYITKYLVFRRIDLPLVASLDDIKVNMSIENLIRNPPRCPRLLYTYLSSVLKGIISSQVVHGF